MRSTVTTAAGMTAGYALDALLGDPRYRLPARIRIRPGKGGPGSGEQHTRPRQGKNGPGAGAPEAEAGAVSTALAVAAPVLLAAATTAVTLATRRHPAVRAAVTALGVWAAVRARDVQSAARRGPADGGGGGSVAPAACPDRSHRTRVAVETLALRTCEQVVAPLFWTGVAGLPGLTAQHLIRSAHRGALRSGESATLVRVTGSAVALVDAAPARLTGLLTVAAAPVAGGESAEAWRVWRRDRHDHPVAGAGQSQAAFAGALGVRLGGPNDTDPNEAPRPFIGDGPRPQEQHLRRAARLAATVGLGALVVSAGLSTVRGVMATSPAVRRAAPAPVAFAARLPHRFAGPAS